MPLADEFLDEPGEFPLLVDGLHINYIIQL
jgi:hypothetical protein